VHAAVVPLVHGDSGARPAGAAVRIPPFAARREGSPVDQWPLRSFLELGALPGAVPCARLHTRHVLWEWGLAHLAESCELLVSEMITNGVQASRVMTQAAVRLWLVSDRAQVVILAWDASSLPPVPADPRADSEDGRGLLLVDAISERWGWYFPGEQPGTDAPGLRGKVVWAIVQLPPGSGLARETAMATLTQVRETTRFLETGSRSGKLAAEATRVMPEGITRETIRRKPYAPAMASAHGSVLVDVDGDERTDLLFNHTALIHGHGYSPVAQAVARQSCQLEAVPFPNEHETALARLLVARVPVDDPLVRFTSSGSEAVMLALRLATAATRRRKIVVFEHCYHGAFVPTSQADAPPPDYLLRPFNAPDLLRHLYHDHGPRIAAVLADLCPVRGALSPATTAFAEQIRDGCARYGALLIADEVVSSRAAPGGMAAAYGLRPDIVCLGKYIGGGLPIGAIAMRRDLGTCFAPGHKPRLGHGGTFNGNPLSMTAGIAALTGFGADRAAILDTATTAVCEELNALFARRDADWSVRQAGSLFHFWPHRNLPAAPGQARHHVTRAVLADLSGFLLRHGVVIAPSGFGCLATVTTPADLDYLAAAIDAYLTR